jgi:uncharacterized protein (DUF433 family)
VVSGRLIDRDALVALPAVDAARLADVSVGQLRRWAEQGIVTPSVASPVSAHRSVVLYGFHDLVALLVAAELREHVSLQHIRQVVEHLRDRDFQRPLTELHFAVKGKQIYFRLPDGTWEGGRSPRQIVFHQTLSLEPLRARIRAATQRPATLAGRVETQRGRLGSKPVFAGTRIPVETVRGYLAHGYTPRDVVKAYPSLTLEDIEAVQSA